MQKYPRCYCIAGLSLALVCVAAALGKFKGSWILVLEFFMFLSATSPGYSLILDHRCRLVAKVWECLWGIWGQWRWCIWLMFLRVLVPAQLTRVVPDKGTLNSCCCMLSLSSKVDGGITKSAQVVNSHLVCDPTIRQPGFDLPRQRWSLLNRFCTEQGHCGACRRKWRLTDLWVLVARPRRCLILSNPVPWQNWMVAYLGYTLPMKMLFRGWPVMAHETHTWRRRLSGKWNEVSII